MGVEDRHIDNLERLADEHVARLDEALAALEVDAIRIANNLPTEASNLVDLDAAIAARAEFRQSIQANLMTEVDALVDNYDEAAASVMTLFTQNSDELMLGQAENISQLKRLSFQGFEEIANTHLETISRNVYQATIAGKPITDVVMDIRHSINGVYIQSNNIKAQELVDFIRENRDDAAKAAMVKEAVDKLHTIYARDRVGNNLRRYAVAFAHDSLMQFSASVNISTALELGAEKWKYYGSSVRDTREFCSNNAGKIFTTEEIREKWANESWSGKSAGDPFIVRGGYNCRHHFRPVFD
jgi:hypothetical protein